VGRAKVLAVFTREESMLRKVVGAVVVLGLCLGIAMADEIRAVITKVDGNKVTFAEMKGKGKDAEKGPEKTLPVSAKVKVVKGKFNKDTMKVDAGDDIENGLKHEMFSKDKLGEKGRNALIVTDDKGKQITEIRIFGRGGKKKDQ
jgi:hypothetical protein